MFDVAEVRSLLARLRTADRSFDVFGAAAHRYALAPRLPEPEVRVTTAVRFAPRWS